MLAGRRPIIYGDGMQSRDFTFVENVVQGNLLAADAEGVAGLTMNVATGRSVTLLDLLAALNRSLGLNIKPEFAEPRAGDVRESLADITVARHRLEYEPTISLQEGLDRSIAYYRSLARA